MLPVEGAPKLPKLPKPDEVEAGAGELFLPDKRSPNELVLLALVEPNPEKLGVCVCVAIRGGAVAAVVTAGAPVAAVKEGGTYASPLRASSIL